MLREWLSFMNSKPQCINYIFIHLQVVGHYLIMKKFITFER